MWKTYFCMTGWQQLKGWEHNMYHWVYVHNRLMSNFRWYYCFPGTSPKVSPWFCCREVRKVNKRRFLYVQNVSLPLFYIEITVAKTGFKRTEWKQFTAHVISGRSMVNSLTTEKISNNFSSGRWILVDSGKISFVIHSVVLGSRNDLT